MRIVNLHNYRGEAIYCGRPMPGRKGSPLRNKHKLTTVTSVAECLEKYRRDLDDAFNRYDVDIILAMKNITAESVLACWCVDLEGDAIFTAPERCHCQVIWKVWKRMQAEKITASNRSQSE